jgi:predicted DNA-binding transcriptional regulator YafY
MKALDLFNRLERMDQLIRLKATGSPKEFAARLQISESMMYNYLDLLKSLGGPIRYCKQAGSYEYASPVRLELGYRTEKNKI